MREDEIAGVTCAYCGEVTGEARYDVEIHAWGPESTYGFAGQTFCSRDHVVTYFAEGMLADIPDETLPQRRRSWVAGALVVVVAALALVGLVALVSWVN